VSPSKLLEQNFENFTVKGSIFQKNVKIALKKLRVLQRQAAITLQRLQMLKTRGQVIPLRDVIFPFLPLESIQSLSPGLYSLYKRSTHPTFLRVRLHIYCIDNTVT